MVNESTESDIILDFTHTTFQYSCFLTGLFILVKNWKLNGKKVLFSNYNPNISSYLQTVRFPDGLDVFDEQVIEKYLTKTYTPIVDFSKLKIDRELVVGTVLKIIQRQTGISGHDSNNVLDYFISELTNNVAEHSESTASALFVQSYPQKQFLEITIADNGIGLLGSFKKTDKFSPIDDQEAMKMAINGKSTKDRPESRGFGISTSRHLLVNGLSGKFCLWSGKSIFLQHGKTNQIIETGHNEGFSGCFVNLRLPTNITVKGSFYDYIT